MLGESLPLVKGAFVVCHPQKPSGAHPYSNPLVVVGVTVPTWVPGGREAWIAGMSTPAENQSSLEQLSGRTK